MCSLAQLVQPGLSASRRTVTHAAGSGQRLGIGSASPGCRLQNCHAPKPWSAVPTAKPSGRNAGRNPQCAASYAAAPGGDNAAAAAAAAAATASPPEQQQPRRPLQLLPTWGPRAVQLVGAAVAMMAWYGLSSAMQGPFASLGMAAAAPASEGARVAGGGAAGGGCWPLAVCCHLPCART